MSTTKLVLNPVTGNLDVVTATVAAATDITGVLPITNGGSNISTYTTGDTLYASASNVLSKLPIGSTSDVLTVVAGVPAWAPSSGGGGISALTGDVTASGTGSVTATLAATTNATITTLSVLTSASSLATVGTITSGTWSGTAVALNKGGTGQTTKASAFDALQPMTTSGDIIYGGASGTGTRLPKGSDGQILTLASGIPAWTTASGTGVKCRAYRASTQSISNATWTKMQLDAESFDTGSNFDTSTYLFTAPTTAYYQINACIFYAATAGGYRRAAIVVNGSDYRASASFSPGVDQTCAVVADIVSLTAGDTVELQAYQTSGIGVNAGQFAFDTFLSIVQL